MREVYGCTESSYAAASCREGWLHLIEDWVILEPVDAHYAPVPPGVASHTVLLTNLANRVQPIIRYDVGDLVLIKPGHCGCGNPAPALLVEGRTSDVLTFPTADGNGHVDVPPLAFGSTLDRTPGVGLFQIVQAAPTRLSVRLLPAPGADAGEVQEAALKGIGEVLTGLGLAHVTVEPAGEPPRQTAGGKFRVVVPLPPTQAMRPNPGSPLDQGS